MNRLCKIENKSGSLKLLRVVGLTVCAACQTGPAGTSSSSGGSAQASSASGGSGTAVGSASTTAAGTSTGGVSTTSGGITTGGLSPFADGGYVFCAADAALDGGTAQQAWLCPPGTYFCGHPGACAQCRSDADCLDQDLPTYDARRPRCDLDSGVVGYEGFCQQCLATADCAALSPILQCDLNPAQVEPSIDAYGFEACAILAAGCPYGTQEIGGCGTGLCKTDADCVDALSPLVQQPAPYCVGGMCQSWREPGFCPHCSCEGVACAGPTSADAGLFCNPATLTCGCESSAQCGGLYPTCVFPPADGGEDATDSGEPVGECGCSNDGDCGDGGLRCLDLWGIQAAGVARIPGGRGCALSCTDPRAPACADINANTPICAPSGVCQPCGSDHDCQQSSGSTGGPHCDPIVGYCGCSSDAECQDGTVCVKGIVAIGGCLPPSLGCNPDVCGGLCLWDSGICAGNFFAGGSGVFPCSSDFDCALSSRGADGSNSLVCDPDGGFCAQCVVDSDCLAAGLAAQADSHCVANFCTYLCGDDTDCVGNPAGPHCTQSSYGGHCGCGQDQDCAGNASGPHCVTDAGDGLRDQCGCASSSDCSAGDTCQPGYASVYGQCSDGCYSDGGCPSGTFCDPRSICRPRCDDGGAGCTAPDMACDIDNRALQNNVDQSGSAPGAIWCYPCVSGADCPSGLTCVEQDGALVPGGSCGEGCDGDWSCHPGEVCSHDDGCRPSCDAGPCPSGQFCDATGAFRRANVCYGCLDVTDCPGDEGCNSLTHTCGSCWGPTYQPNAETGGGGPYDDCPPDAVCSNFWTSSIPGVCLQNCDNRPCDDPGDTCEVFPNFTPDHKYCFGCLQDSDCADAGPGARCDTSVGLTFTCKVPAAP